MRSYAQRLTNAYAVNAAGTTVLYSLTDLTTQLLAQDGVVQNGHLFSAPTIAAVTTAFAAATTSALPANATLTDLGITVRVVVGDAIVKLRQVKYQTNATTFVTGYVVVENNYNGGMASANLLKVGVYRV